MQAEAEDSKICHPGELGSELIPSACLRDVVAFNYCEPSVATQRLSYVRVVVGNFEEPEKSDDVPNQDRCHQI